MTLNNNNCVKLTPGLFMKPCLATKGIEINSLKKTDSQKAEKTICYISSYKGYKVTTTYKLIGKVEMEKLRDAVARKIKIAKFARYS